MNPGDTTEGTESFKEGRKTNNIIKLATVLGNLGSHPLGTYEEPCRMFLRVNPLRDWEGRALIYGFSLVE